MTVTGVDWRVFPQKIGFLHHEVRVILDGGQAHHALHRVLMGSNGGFFHLLRQIQGLTLT